MSSNFKAPNQRIALIALAECVPTNYQRTTSPTQVAKIVNKFSEAKLGVLTVSLRDGKYHIIDGLISGIPDINPYQKNRVIRKNRQTKL